jgi:hypothetical protein
MTIRIDVHHVGETWYTWHIRFLRRSTYATHMLFVGSLRMWQPFTLTQQSWMRPTIPEKKAPDTIPSTPTYRSAGPPLNFSPLIAIEVVMKIKHLLTNKLHPFTRHISLECDQYVQYLLMGANPSVLIRHSQGLPPWISWLATSLTPPLPTDDSLFFPKGPVRSQVNNLTITTWTKERSNPNLISGTPPLDFYHSLSSKHSSD